MRNLQIDGFWLVTIASIIWGTIGVATQAIYDIDTTTSTFINLARTAIATPILLGMCWRMLGRKMFDVPGRDLLIMILMGTFLVLSQVAYFAAIRYVGVTISTLLTMCVSPLVVAIASVMLKLESLSKRYIVALLCAMAGSALLVGIDTIETANPDLLTGTIISLISAVFYGGVLICGRFLASAYHPLQVNAIAFCAGTLVLLLINLSSEIVMVQTVEGWLLVVYLGLIPTAFAYWIFQIGLRTVSATTASIVIMLDPLVAAGLAWVLFGEILSGAGVIGAALLMSSLGLLSIKRR